MNYKTIALSFLLTCMSCVSPSNTSDTEIKDGITKVYFIKGMTCGGCIFHVDKALEKNSQMISYQGKKIGVGTLKLTFTEINYKNNETDCAVKNSIESQTEYKVYYDKLHAKAVCSESDQRKI